MEITYRGIDNSEGGAVEKVRQVFRSPSEGQEAIGQSGFPVPGSQPRL